ncbi:AraC family transcriptional regulator [Nocardioides sp. SLBN-35]|uniref:helix-turn-helix domain-containing protein n=1 Tax=Nocardioides sp. SLBN-35 TaxID=2768445 RepID=UPI00114DEFE7|nr:helix-turn-helix transcriptional regulator [Nocardioides sp. SLBN-35]TQK70912.1 AraC-like DNA-binding protein [Nocardioides sp. SLBN-35]
MIPAPPVPAALRGYVVARIPYDVDFGAPGMHRGLPSTTITLVLPLDDPLRVSWAGRPASLHSAWASLSGLHTEPAAIHHDGSQRGVQVALTVEGVRVLLGRPAADLSGALTDLDEAVVPQALRDLPERLHALASWPARVALVDRTLAGLAARGGDPAPRAEVAHALALLTSGNRVAEVAEEVGYSRRRLGTLVRAECGLAPKAFQRVARLETARGLLGHRPLAEVADACGYADQAHLTREWTALAGCTPTTWLREEFPFVQDRDDDGGAGLQA